MHAFVADIALLLAAVFGTLAALLAVALLLGGETLPRSPPESFRRTGAAAPARRAP